MDEQVEEREVLEMENWNAEYDIGEDEEERLLEEDEVMEQKHSFPCESETSYPDADFENQVLEEEDVLDLGLNEDIVEYEEPPSSDCQESPEKQASTSSVQQEESAEKKVNISVVQSITSVKPQPKRFENRVGPRPGGGFRKTFPFNGQVRTPTSVQMHSGPPLRMGFPGFPSQQHQFNGPPPRPLMRRISPGLGFPPPEGFIRNTMPLNKPFLSQDYNHGPPGQRLQRNGFEEHPQGMEHFVDMDRNNPGSRYFINPHYRGSAMIRHDGSSFNSQTISDQGRNFPPLGKPPFRMDVHCRPPPPILGQLSPSRARAIVPPMRFPPPPPSQRGAPPLPFSALTTDHSVSHRFKMSSPQSLMDVVLPAPFPGGRPPYHPEPLVPQRFRPPSYETPFCDSAPGGLQGFPIPGLPAHPAAVLKRPAAPDFHVTTPMKQLRIDPAGNIQISRSITVVNPSSSSENLRAVPRAINPPSNPGAVRLGTPRNPSAQRFPLIASISVEPRVSSAGTHRDTTSVLGSPPSSSSLTGVTSHPETATTTSKVTSKSTETLTSTAASANAVEASNSTALSSSTKNEELTPDMKEYLEKMEEQRKKREEVLRLKEERRRQKLASAAGKDDVLLTVEATPLRPNPNSPSANLSGLSRTSEGVKCAGVTNVSSTGNQPSGDNAAVPSGKQSSALSSSSSISSLSHVPVAVSRNGVSPTSRKTVLVKPTPATSNELHTPQSANETVPPTNVGVSRRYKIIIVKNKSGKILERRRVPIDEIPAPVVAGNANSQAAMGHPEAHAGQPVAQARMSETVTLENLNPDFTEDDVRNLCQRFGSVQEIYPKLKEGKAIVRFSTVSGAKNFLCNHNTPGLCVRYL